MTRLLKAAFALLCAFGINSFSHAQLTTVTAAHIYMGGTLIPAGMVTFTPVTANGTAIAFAQSGGGLNAPSAFSCGITAGAITGTCTVPDAALTTPANIFYQITVVRTSPASSFTLQAVPGITGTTWPLDAYGPPLQLSTIQAIQISYGTAAPTSPCIVPSLYIRNASGGQLYMCVGTSPIWVLVTGSGGGSVTASAMQAALVGQTGCNTGGLVWSPQLNTCISFDPLGAAAAAQAAAIANSATTALQKSGGTMTGPIVLPGDPTTALQASTKQYVDAHSSGGTVSPLLNASADFIFKSTSGSTLADITGNGNNGTAGSGSSVAPTMDGYGWDFSGGQAGVIMSPTLNTSKTFLVVFYAKPLPQSSLFPASNYFTLISSTLGATGLNIMASNINASGNFEAGVYGLSTFVGGSSNTTTPDIYSGMHAYVLVCGTSGSTVDHLYLDGVEVAHYGAQGTSCGAQTSGNLYLGTTNVSPWNVGMFNGIMYRAAFWSSALTSAQVKSVSQAGLAYVEALGIPVTPISASIGQPTLIADGDSITAGFLATTPFSAELSLTNQPTYTVLNYGIPSITANSLAGSEPNRVGTLCRSISGPVPIAILLDGTNDFNGNNASASAQTVWASYGSQIATLKHAGCRVFVGTMISRGGTGFNGATNDANKNALNALILDQAKAVGADGIIHYAGIPALGADGANANSTFFNPDLTHPKQVGQDLLAVAASNSLNYYFGSTIANPHVVTTTTYTLLSGDRAVVAAPTANAAYTMADCTGPAGEPYTIINSQSAHTLTITGGSSQPINGLASAITIPSNSTVTLRDVAGPLSSGGCSWSM